jgi:hypothetical protein
MCKLLGLFSQNKKAMLRADYCLSNCTAAWSVKMMSEGHICDEAAALEKFYARNHNRFLRLAYRKPPFKKD